MLALHDRPASVDPFRFALAERLGKTVAELDDMPHSEYVQWAAYTKTVNTIREVRSGRS